MDTKRWLVVGMLVALLLATGPAVGTTLAQEADGGTAEPLASLSDEGYFCMEYWCYNPDTGDFYPLDPDLWENPPND